MEKTYFSDAWYRIADLRLRLRSHVRLHRTIFRGHLWYVLQDRTSGRFHRFTPETYFVINLMDGERSMQEVWDIACNQMTEKVLTQDEVIQLLGQLHVSDVLFGDVPPDIEELTERGRKQRNRKLLMSFMNPLAIRLSLIDPNEFLNATYPLIRPLFSWFGALIYIGLVAYACLLAGMNWEALTDNMTDRVLSTENLFLMLVAYPFIKTIHELGHAYTVKRWGGDVHEIGIMMLVFMPVPYVDASDSLAFRSKWQRALVGAAGILVEVFLAAIALIIWMNAEAGLVRAFAFNIMLIGGVSTLLFNGNPLLKFDGYYVLSDIIQIPNLASRANKYIGYLIQRYAFGISSATTPVTGKGEAPWLFFYSLGAFGYRLIIMTVIIVFVSQQFFVIGTLIAIWAVILMLGVPLAKHIWFLLTNPILRHNRTRAFRMVGTGLAALAVVLFAVPLPHSTIAQGVVWLPGNGILHAGADGIVVAVSGVPGGHAEPGMPLVRLDDPLLIARVSLLDIRVRELGHRLDKQNLSDLANAQIVREELRLAHADLALARERQSALTVRAQSAGTIILPDAENLIGRFIRRGETVAYVAQFDEPVIRVIVPEDDVDLVRNEATNMSIWFSGDLSQTFAAEVVREMPSLTNTIPSAALSTKGGGELTLDPMAPGQNRTLSNQLHMDLRLTENLVIPRIGNRVYVRFHFGSRPLVYRMYRSIRQIFLSTFQV